MSEVRWQEVPEMRRPILLAAFQGWFDAGTSATTAVEWLRERFDAEPVAAIDAEVFFDFTQQRPEVRLEEGERYIVWPGPRSTRPRVSGADQDRVLVSASNPICVGGPSPTTWSRSPSASPALSW